MNYELKRVSQDGEIKFEISLTDFCYESFNCVKYYLQVRTPLKLSGFHMDVDKASIWLNNSENYSDEVLEKIIHDCMSYAFEVEECRIRKERKNEMDDICGAISRWANNHPDRKLFCMFKNQETKDCGMVAALDGKTDVTHFEGEDNYKRLEDVVDKIIASL